MDAASPTTPLVVTLIGLGRVGLPTAALLARAGHHVHGVDRDPHHVDRITRSRCWHDEPGLIALIEETRGSGRLTLHTDLSSSPRAEVYLIAIPLDVGEGKEERTIERSSLHTLLEAIVAHAGEDPLIVLESTSSPLGVRAVKEELTRLFVARPFSFVHAPERIAPGRALEEFEMFPRLLGAASGRDRVRALALYNSFCPAELHPCTPEEAALAKLFENASRHVQIALANELATVSEDLGMSMIRARDLAITHPRVSILTPGPGVGGACLSLATSLLRGMKRGEERADESLLAASEHLHARLPSRLAQLVLRRVERGTHVALFGLAYKPETCATTSSPALRIAQLLHQGGVTVHGVDPLVRHDEDDHTHDPSHGHTLSDASDALARADAIVFATAHDVFAQIDPLLVSQTSHARLVFDLCGVLDHDAWRRAGFELFARGEGFHGSTI